jgi:pimeloyl-ACP methyl ester carboxylesterase/DNA-binding CsgD family transcriptional regulator
LLSHLEFDWTSPVWRHWLLELARYHTLVRYDERGCGLSDWDVEDFSLDAWVQDLEMVVDALGLERFPLLGLSQGGPIAITYAVRHPEKVSHLILYGSYARGRFKRNLSPEQMEEVETLLKLMKVGWGRDNPAFRQVFTTLLMPEATAEQMRRLNELQRLSASPENAVRFRYTFYSIDVSDLASRVTVPTLVLHVRGDAAVPFEESRRLAALIPGARFVPLEGNNHILLESEPAWSRFLAEVRSFIGTEATEPEPAPAPQPFPELTGREREILELIAQGLNNTQIAQRLVISPKTVRNHITNIFSKLQVTDRAQAIVRARDAGLGYEK